MIATFLGKGRPTGVLRRIDWALGHLFSFEAAFVLFLYSNELKTISPIKLPVDETVLFGALTLMVGAIVIYREGIYLRGLPVVSTALLFTLYVVASGAWSPARVLLFKSMAYLLTFNLMTIVTGALILASRRDRALRFFVLALGPGILMAFYGLYIYIRFGDFRRWAGFMDYQGRVYLAFGRTVVNAAGTALAFVLFTRFLSLRQIACAVIFGACALFLLVGGGRAPFLGLIAAGLVGLTTRPPRVGRGSIKVPYATVAAVLLFAAFAAYIAYIILSGNLTTTLARFVKLADQADDPGMERGPNRFEYWAAAYHYFVSAPLFGHGLDSFGIMFLHGREAEGAQPHNIFLQILCETGLVGMALFCLFFWSGIRHAPMARLKRDPLQTCTLLFIITSSMNALFALDLTGQRAFFLGISLLALRPLPRLRSSTDEGAAAMEADLPVGTRRRRAGAATLSPQPRPAG